MFDLQCWISYCCTAVIQLYTHTHLTIYIVFFPFYILFHYGLLQDTEYSSLCCTAGPFYSSILCIVVCIPGGSVIKNSPANAGVMGSVPGLGRSPGGGNGNPLQYTCLGNPMAREPGGLQSMESQQSWTRLSD